MLTIVEHHQLIEGKWYAIGIQDIDGIDWGAAPIHRYEGDGYWSNDDSEPVEYVWDTFLQLEANINSADAYMPQC